MTTTRSTDSRPAYRDPTLPIAERVDDLIERMTPEEKAAQLGSAWIFELLEDREVSPDRAAKLLGLGLGQITRISGASSLHAREAAEAANAIQRHLVEETRLGIPAIIHEEICSGLMARDAIVFPQAIGAASTWDPALIEAQAGVVRAQMRAIGAHQGLSPVLDVCRDPRWGRTEETFGEDPHLVARMGVAFVRGLQGDNPTTGVIATGKHFVGYGISEGGMNWAPAHIGPRELRDVYLHPFEAAVREAGLQSVMNGYHELDGVPCTADRTLLTDLLRDDWGFAGTVVSDYFSVRQLEAYHRLARDSEHAAALAIDAGIDVELPNTDCYGEPLLRAVATRAVSQDTFDAAVRRVLATKFAAGLFEAPYVDVEAVGDVMAAPAHRDLARKMADRSLVLLRNDGILPLATDPGSVAVIGPNADAARHLLGDYTYPAHVESLMEMRDRSNVFSMPMPQRMEMDGPVTAASSVLDAMAERLGDRVRYARGCDVNSADRSGFDEAVTLAAACDVAVLVMGDKSGLTEDCTCGETRDRATLDLPGLQEDLVAAVAATGTPVVLVLVAGRPCGSPVVHEAAAAVLMAWMPGDEGAGAIADALLGVTVPGGKLPISFPRSSGQIPVYYGHKVSGGRSHWKGDYVSTPSRPLYPFGHGLTYTSFEVRDPVVEEDVVPWDGAVTVSATVANTGERDGEEVLQVYIRDPMSTVTRPVLELKGFARVPVPAGAERHVAFRLPVGQMGSAGRDLDYVVEPGLIEVHVGTSAVELVEAGTFEVVPAADGSPVIKRFGGEVVVDADGALREG